MLAYLISANVTNAVVTVVIYMRSFILLIVGDIMIADSGMPVRCSAFFPSPCIIVEFMLAELIFTNITNTVIVVGVNVLVESVCGNYGTFTLELFPVIFFVATVNVGLVRMLAHLVISAFFAYAVFYGAVIVALSFHSRSLCNVSANRRMPVTCFVPLPYIGIKSVVGTAHVVSADVTFAVVITQSIRLVYVSFVIDRRNVVSAYRSMPMAVFVGRPCIAFGIPMYVIVIPFANVTNSIVVDIGVGAFALWIYRVSAGRLIPMLCIVYRPFFLVGMYVVVVPFALITKSVIVSVRMLGIILLNAVSTGGSIPVVSQVVGVGFLIGVSVIVIPRTNVANTVVIDIGVRLFVFRIYITVASVTEEVVSLVIGIIFFVFVGAECIIAGFDVTFSVVVKVFVSAFYFGTALIAFEILVIVLVCSTFNSFATFITLKVTVVVEVSCAAAFDCEPKNIYFGEVYSGDRQACA